MPGNNILITGASGFVGSNLGPYLTSRGNQVFSWSLRDPETAMPDLSEVDTVVHLAGKAHDLDKTDGPEAYEYANYILTKKMFECFLASSARLFIFMSSIKAVTDHPGSLEVSEDDLPMPGTAYGKSKLKAEQYLLNQDLTDGRKIFILRPCMIHGRGNKGNLNLLYKMAVKGIPYPLAAFHNRRSFLSMDNLSFIIGQIVERDDIPGGIYNLSDDEAMSTNNIIQIIATEIGREPRLWKLNKALVMAIAWAGDRLPLLLNSERLKKLTEDYIVSNKKIKGVLNKALPLSSQDGLRITIRSFKHEGK